MPHHGHSHGHGEEEECSSSEEDEDNPHNHRVESLDWLEFRSKAKNRSVIQQGRRDSNMNVLQKSNMAYIRLSMLSIFVGSGHRAYC